MKRRKLEVKKASATENSFCHAESHSIIST